jgi:hypothetical protein
LRCNTKEADDIPQSIIHQASWCIETVSLDKIRVDQKMIDDHNGELVHIKRRDGFIKTINDGRKILPLIVLGKELFLVDGYSRYRALKQLNITHATVARQRFDK